MTNIRYVLTWVKIDIIQNIFDCNKGELEMYNYRIYPIQLGVDDNTDWSHCLINTRFGEKMTGAFLSYLIMGKKEIMIVDTGFRTNVYTKGHQMSIEGNAEQAYTETFNKLGVSFNQVTHILLTHLHWDHMENNHLFPKAKIYVQRREIETAAAPFYPLYYEPQDIGHLISDESDRLVFLDGDIEITPGVKAVFGGGHTLGSQMIYVNTSEGNAIITGDIVNIYQNLEIRSVKELDVVGWVKAIKKIKHDADIILPMHDPEVLKRHPVVGQ